LSFRLAQQLLRRAKTILNLRRQLPIALVGNKTDKEAARSVPDKDGQRLADEYNATFLETSVKNGANSLTDLFIHLLKEIKRFQDASFFV
jgi:hypothetical protein